MFNRTNNLPGSALGSVRLNDYQVNRRSYIEMKNNNKRIISFFYFAPSNGRYLLSTS